MSHVKLLVVHGMGKHDKASVKKEVTDALKTAFGFYESLKGKTVDQFEVVPVVYNDIFEDYRDKLTQQNGTLAQRIAAVDGPITTNVAQEIVELELTLGADTFFTTHWLDVLLYRFTLLSEPVRLRVAEAVATAVAEVGPANVHVLGHSLGTAVVHDALAKSYGPENIRTTDGKTTLNLSPVTHKLGSLHLVSNVSRALQTFVKIGSSIVRPGPLGCVSVFREYRHKLDPISMIRPFTPTDNEGWVPHDIFKFVYRLIEPTSVTAANVHDLKHYLTIPEIHLSLFRVLLGFKPKKAEQDAGEKLYFATTVEAKAKALQQAFGDLNIGDRKDVQALLDAAKRLKDLVHGFGEQF